MVTLTVQRDRHRRVTEHLRGYLRVDMAAQHQRRGRVAKVMEPNPRQASTVENPTKGVVHVGHLEEPAVLAAEDKISIPPERTHGFPLVDLAGGVPSQGINRDHRQLDSTTGPSRLRLRDRQSPATSPRQRPGDL
jgi:hypothetical protein